MQRAQLLLKQTDAEVTWDALLTIAYGLTPVPAND